MTLQEAIDLLSVAARSSTWQGASPALAWQLVEVLRSETEACFKAQIGRDHMRDERDEAVSGLRWWQEAFLTWSSGQMAPTFNEKTWADWSGLTGVQPMLESPEQLYESRSIRLTNDLAKAERERDEARTEVDGIEEERAALGAEVMQLRSDLERCRRLALEYRQDGNVLEVNATRERRGLVRERDTLGDQLREARAEVERVRGCLLHAAGERDEAHAALLRERAEWEECTRKTAAQWSEKVVQAIAVSEAARERDRLKAEVERLEAELGRALAEVQDLRGNIECADGALRAALRERDAALAEAEVERLKDGARLADQICYVLGRVVGDSGESEGAVQVAERLIRERDRLKAEVERLKAEARRTRSIVLDTLAILDSAEEPTCERAASVLRGHGHECVNADPKPTPPVDVPNIKRKP